MQQTLFLDHINMITGTNKEILNYIVDSVDNGKKIWITTLNSLMYMQYLKDENYKKAIDSSSFSIADGIGIVKFLRKTGIDTERCTGIDTLKNLLSLKRSKKYRVFLLGTTDKIMKKTLKILERYTGIEVVGYNNGFFSKNEENKIVDRINKLNVDFLFVGMGIPRQEVFILDNYKKLNVNLFMGVGGSFDVISGEIKRAPMFYQKLGIEWLYRMLTQPKRIKKVPDLLKFYFKMLFYKK